MIIKSDEGYISFNGQKTFLGFSHVYILTGSRKLFHLLVEKTKKYRKYEVSLSRACATHGIPKLYVHPIQYREDEEYIRIQTGEVWVCRAVNERGEVLLSTKSDTKGREIEFLQQYQELNKWTLLG